jgi:hypothetical protein
VLIHLEGGYLLLVHQKMSGRLMTDGSSHYPISANSPRYSVGREKPS